MPSVRRLLPFLFLLLLAPGSQALPWDNATAPDVTFHLVTADPGRHIGSAWFGHSGLLVEGPNETRYFAYRLDIEDSPLRGALTTFTDVPFSLHERSYQGKIDEYTGQQRSMRTMELLLSAEEKERLIAGMESELNRDTPHAYRMIHDNCSTRLRDLLDQAITGGLPGAPDPAGSTYRDVGPAYVEHDVLQANVLYFFLGRGVDTPLSVKDTMFLPLVLERHLLNEGLGAAPVTVLEYPFPELGPSHARIVAVPAAAGVLVAAAIVGLGWLQRRGDVDARRFLGRAMTAFAVLALLPLGVLMASWTGALAPHLAHNLNILLLSPLLLGWLVIGPAMVRGAAWAPKWARRLAQAQMVLAAAALVLHVAGAQVMDTSLALLLPVHAAAWFAFTVGAVPSDSAPHHRASATPAPRGG